MINRTEYVLNGIVSLIDTRRLVLLVIKSSQNFLQRNTSKELGILLVIIHRYRHTLRGMASLKDTRRLVFLFIKSSLNLLQRNTRIRYIVNGTEQKRLCIMQKYSYVVHDEDKNDPSHFIVEGCKNSPLLLLLAVIKRLNDDKPSYAPF